jgi:ankyrin repeat protein
MQQSNALEQLQQELDNKKIFDDIKKCIESNDTERALSILSHNQFDATSTDDKGNTLIHLACQYENPDLNIIKKLIEITPPDDLRSLVNCINDSGMVPLHYIANNPNKDAFDILVSAGADKAIKHRSISDSLDIALMTNYNLEQKNDFIKSSFNSSELEEKLTFYLKNNTNPNEIKTLISLGAGLGMDPIIGEKGITKKSPLRLACENKNIDAVRALIEKAKDSSGNAESFVNQEFSDPVEFNNKFTPLHIACIQNNTEMAKLLLDNGANPHNKSMKITADLLSPFDLAIEHSPKSATAILIRNHPSFKSTPTSEIESQGEQTLPLEEKRRYREAIHKIINNSQPTSEEQLTAIKSLIVEKSLKIKEDLSYKNKTPIHATAIQKKPEILKILLETISSQIEDEDERRSFINSKFTNGNTALHIACQNNDLESFNLLIEAGADMTIANGNGKTPMDLVNASNGEFRDALDQKFTEDSKGLSPSQTSKRPASTSPQSAVAIKAVKTTSFSASRGGS